VKLAVLGATGSIGRELVTQALDAGHDVTALVRGQPKPHELDGRATLVGGDVTSIDAVNRVVDGNDVVVSALGHAKGSPDDVLARGISNVIAAMQAESVDRLVVLSSPAVGDPQDRPGLLYRVARVFLGAVMPAVVRDHREQARLVEETASRGRSSAGPVIFTDGPHTGRYHAGPITPETGARVSRADLADFMLASATEGMFVRELPLVGQ
jgi:nucleoside-diphosphate-sugar epimerase